MGLSLRSKVNINMQSVNELELIIEWHGTGPGVCYFAQIAQWCVYGQWKPGLHVIIG